MAGAASLRSRVEEARARRDEASEGFLSRVAKKQEPQPEPKPQGPAQRIERPSMRREAPANLGRPQPQVQHVTTDRPYTETPSIQSSDRGPILAPDDHSRLERESNTVGYMEPSRREDRPRPPRPNVMPEITPVAALKNQVAREQQYSDKARDVLNNTGVRMRLSPLDPPIPLADAGRVDSGQPGFTEGESLGGYYVEPKLNEWLWPLAALPQEWQRPFRTVPRPQIFLENQSPEMNPESVLAHEFAHKWDAEQMPVQRQREWRDKWSGLVDPWTKERTLGRGLADDPVGAGIESYAHYAEHGPMQMPPENRGYWYPGMYREGLGEQRMPDVATYMTQDELYAREMESQSALRPSPYSTEYWTKNWDAPWGYYEDGSREYPPGVFPRRWNKPQFPSLSMYEDLGVQG
jgi:hypothetical protein